MILCCPKLLIKKYLHKYYAKDKVDYVCIFSFIKMLMSNKPDFIF